MIRDASRPANVQICGVPVQVGSPSDAFAQIKDRPDLIKDQASGAVLNTDQQGLMAYRARRHQIQEQRMLADRVDDLERKIDRILAVLTDRERE